MLIKKKRFPILHILAIGFLPSGIKKMLYRLKGYRIGKNVSLAIGSVILGENVIIAEGSSIGFFAIVKARELRIDRYVKIGAFSYIDTNKVVIGEDTRINEQVFIGGIKDPESALVLGKRVIIMQMSFINPTLPIHIGDDSGIGGDCLLFTHGSWNSILENYPVTFAPINIGKNVWLPWRVFIAPGVDIGDGAVIGANSFVNKAVPAYSLVAGSPARVIKTDLDTFMPKEEKIKILDQILSRFTKHVRHHGYEIVSENNNRKFYQIVLKNDRGSHAVYFQKEPNPHVSIAEKDSILILLETDKSILPEDFSMLVNINSKERVGTSLVGEELLSYFSRYGVRFNRLD